MIEQDIRNFNQQLSWEPVIENCEGTEGNSFCELANAKTSSPESRAIVLGIGGSHLGADLLNAYDAKLDLLVHSNYGLPESFGQRARSNLLADSRLDLASSRDLIIASSYSGNTKEVLDGLEQALVNGFKTAVVTSGGKLLEIAKEKNLPYVHLPVGLQPRMSAGYQVKALAKLLGRKDILEEVKNLSQQLDPSELETKGKELAEKLQSKIPVIYTSSKNFALAYTWKIRFNETAKVPAFYNLFPEMNHNEMSGFEVLQGSTLDLQKGRTFIFLLLADSEDHPQIKKRMEIFSKLFTEKGFSIERVDLIGEGRFYRLFSSLILADWTSYYLAKKTGADPEQIPLVEEFKKLLQ